MHHLDKDQLAELKEVLEDEFDVLINTLINRCTITFTANRARYCSTKL